jgi:hypothetical protein
MQEDNSWGHFLFGKLNAKGCLYKETAFALSTALFVNRRTKHYYWNRQTTSPIIAYRLV